jgi:hypothetical protein
VLVLASSAPAALVQGFEVLPRPNKASKKHEPRSISLRIRIGIRDDAGARPSALRRVVIRFNKGGRFNGRRLPKCDPDELRARGPTACPRRSKIGSGTATADARPIVSGVVDARLSIYNGERRNGNETILIYAVPDISSPITLVGRLDEKRSRRYDYRLTFDVPPIPTLPGQPNASVTSVVTQTYRRIVQRKRVRFRIHGKLRRRTVRVPLIAAPRTCRKRKWYAEGTFTYESGETIQRSISTRCRR